MQVFKETANYRIQVVEDPEFGEQMYGIVNKETEVCEYRDRIFPRIIQAIADLQKHYDEAVNQPESVVNDSDDNIIRLQ